LNTLTLPNLGHVGLVVSDIPKFLDHFVNLFGITNFEIYNFEAVEAKLFDKQINDFCLKIAIGSFINNIKIELIEPINDGGFYTKYLDKYGNGLNHLAFYVNNISKWRQYFIDNNLPIVFEAIVVDEIRGERHIFYTKLKELNYYYEFAEVFK